MKNIWFIFKKEFKSYFNSPVAYVYIILFLSVPAWFFLKRLFSESQADMRGYFEMLPMVYLIFIPAVSMRLWAEENKMGTIEVLMTLPVRSFEIIIGKFVAAWALVGVILLLSFPLPITVCRLGDADTGLIVGGYIGAFLMAGSFLSIGIFISCITENQIVAFIVSSVACLILFLIGSNFVLSALPDWIVPFLSSLGLGNHFASISRGVIDSRDIFYYLSVMVFCIFLNYLFVEKREW
jgi:ABC-2 type transport system permease protein